MNVKNFAVGLILALTVAHPVVSGKKQSQWKAKTEIHGTGTPVLWREPGNIRSRNLFYGSGGKEHQPHAPYTFVKEDLEGSSPKFVVRDRDGIEWKVKLGLEARPETVATRIVWAAGFFTSEDYFLPELHVQKLPARLQRGRKLVDPDGTIRNVRLKREPHGEKKLGNWSWRDNPFAGTRELNGLKTVMAVINNWDVKDINNAVYQAGSEQIYMVSDLGATFGPAGRSYPLDKTKGNLDKYERARFIRRVDGNLVDFQAPARPRFVFLVAPREYYRRIQLEWIGRDIPRADARWMGDLLSRLSKAQIRDAFRAAGYSPSEIQSFASILEGRIVVLTDL